MDDETRKTQGLANGMLLLFHSLEEKTELLRPIISRRSSFKGIKGNPKAIEGFVAIRLTLALDLVKDCSRITFDSDSDDKSPSINKVLQRIKSEVTREKLRKEHIQRKSDTERFDKEYERIYKRAVRRYERLINKDIATNIKKARNKVAAHSEIKRKNKKDGYRLRDISEFNISWTELVGYVNTIRPLVNDLIYLVLAMSCLEKSFSNHYKNISRELWKVIS